MKLAINFRLLIPLLKNFYHLLKKYLGEIFLTIGAGLAIYNLTGFSHQATRFYTPPRPTTVNTSYWSVNYYYTDWQKILITLGVVLIIVGILLIKNRKNNNSQILN